MYTIGDCQLNPRLSKTCHLREGAATKRPRSPALLQVRYRTRARNFPTAVFPRRLRFRVLRNCTVVNLLVAGRQLKNRLWCVLMLVDADCPVGTCRPPCARCFAVSGSYARRYYDNRFSAEIVLPSLTKRTVQLSVKGLQLGNYRRSFRILSLSVGVPLKPYALRVVRDARLLCMLSFALLARLWSSNPAEARALRI